jgi:hypothetical protein
MVVPGRLAELRKARAPKGVKKPGAHRADVGSVIDEIRSGGAITLQAIARELNRRGIASPRGGIWGATQVRRVLLRAGR